MKLRIAGLALVLLAGSVPSSALAQSKSYFARSVVAPSTPRTYTGTWSQVGTAGSCQDGVVTTTYQPKCSNGDCGPAPAAQASTTRACNVYRTCGATQYRAVTGTPTTTPTSFCYLDQAIDVCTKTANAVACSVERTNTLYGCDTYKPTVYVGTPGSATVVGSSSALAYAGTCQ